ncbi:MAG: hypothetical protein RL754_881, partial [Bacteroidota bacterium]
VNRSAAAGKGFITHSSGNHGAALAWAAAQIGEKANIIMPSNAPATKIEAVKQYGGRITFCEPTLEARESTAAEVQAQTGAVLIHPYDNYDIIAGQATATMELLDECPDLEWIFVPVGGGGLLAGAALANHYFGHAKVVGCEPINAGDAHESVVSGNWTPVQNPNTIADGLRTSLGLRNFPLIKELVAEITLLTEAEIAEGWSFIVSRMKQYIEPSAGVGVAAALKHFKKHQKDSLSTKTNAGIILCGGNMDVHIPSNWNL